MYYKPKGFTPQIGIPKPEKVIKPKYKINKLSEKKKLKLQEEKAIVKEQEAFFKQWFDEHPTHKCYESGVTIPFYNKMFVHHIIAKRFQERYNIDIITNPDNLILLSLMYHSKVETNIDFTPKVKELTEKTYKLFEKYLI